MPAFAGPLLGFSIGALLARWGRGARGISGAAPLILFGALVLAPACAYPLLFFPDWAFAYLIDSRSIPSALVLALLIVDAAAPAAGFVLARKALSKEALGEDPAAHAAALALAILPAGAAVLISVALAPRLATEGSFAMVRGQFGTSPLWKSPLGYALVWMGACVVAGAWLTARAMSGLRSPAEATASGLRPPAEATTSVPRPPAEAAVAPKAYLGAKTKRRG